MVVFGRNYETNIKHKKGPAEAKKAKITAKHLRQIVLLCKESGPDESSNPRLARQIRSALKENVPRSTIDRRIKSFKESKAAIIDLEVSGYGANGLAVLVSGVTDNTNRFRNEVKEAFKAVGGQIEDDGCLSHIFTKEGVLRFDDVDEEALMEASMEAEVEDMSEREDGGFTCTTLPENMHDALDAFEEQGLEPVSSSVELTTEVPANLGEEGTYECKRLLHLLEEIDDVGEIHHNGILQEGVELKFNTYGIPLRYSKK